MQKLILLLIVTGFLVACEDSNTPDQEAIAVPAAGDAALATPPAASTALVSPPTSGELPINLQPPE